MTTLEAKIQIAHPISSTFSRPVCMNWVANSITSQLNTTYNWQIMIAHTILWGSNLVNLSLIGSKTSWIFTMKVFVWNIFGMEGGADINFSSQLFKSCGVELWHEVMQFYSLLLIAYSLDLDKLILSRVSSRLFNQPVLHWYRAGRSYWKMGARFTFLPLTRSIFFDGFSKFFFLLKAGFNWQFVKKGCAIAHSAHPVPPALWYIVSHHISIRKLVSNWNS